MLDKRVIFAIHNYANQGYAKARIAALLRLDPKSVAKYLANPEQERKKVVRKSLLDPFREEIGELLRRDTRASAAVILQRLQGKGFTGKVTILRDYLATVRPKKQRAFIRFETAPGEQCQIDWGHFGTINYGNTARKLSCLAVIEGHSRMLYLRVRPQPEPTGPAPWPVERLHFFPRHPEGTGSRQHAHRSHRTGRLDYPVQQCLP